MSHDYFPPRHVLVPAGLRRPLQEAGVDEGGETLGHPLPPSSPFLTSFLNTPPFFRNSLRSSSQLYMFNLSWHMRLQLSAAFVGSICSLILFAVRHVWTWNTMNKGLSLLCKTTWFVIIVLEVREIKQEEVRGWRALDIEVRAKHF